jgi:hypothetical protein
MCILKFDSRDQPWSLVSLGNVEFRLIIKVTVIPLDPLSSRSLLPLRIPCSTTSKVWECVFKMVLDETSQLSKSLIYSLPRFSLFKILLFMPKVSRLDSEGT